MNRKNNTIQVTTNQRHLLQFNTSLQLIRVRCLWSNMFYNGLYTLLEKELTQTIYPNSSNIAFDFVISCLLNHNAYVNAKLDEYI